MNHPTHHPSSLLLLCWIALPITACTGDEGGRGFGDGLPSATDEDGHEADGGKADDSSEVDLPGFLDVLPPVVRLHLSTGASEPQCLGTLMGCNTVLTAAHCIKVMQQAAESGKQPTAHAEWYSKEGECATLAETDLPRFVQECYRVQEVPLDMDAVEVTDQYFVDNPSTNELYPDAAIIGTAGPLDPDLLFSGMMRDAGYCSDPNRAPFVAFPQPILATEPDPKLTGYAVSWRVDGPEIVRERHKQLQHECIDHFFSLKTDGPDLWSNSMGSEDAYYLYLSARPCDSHVDFSRSGDSGGPLLGADDTLYAMAGDRLVLYGVLHGSRSALFDASQPAAVVDCLLGEIAKPFGVVVDNAEVCKEARDHRFDAFSSLFNPALQTWAAQRYSALEGADWR